MSIWIQFSHNDLDGMACILLGQLMGIAHSYPCSYTTNSKLFIETRIKDYYEKGILQKVDGLLLSDLNLTEKQINNIVHWTKDDTQIKIIDHHGNTSVQINHPKVSFYGDETACAARHLYNRLVGKLSGVEKYADFIEAVNGFDIWQHDTSPFSVDMQRVFYHWIFMEEQENTTYIDKLYAFVDAVKKDPPTKDYKPGWYTFHLIAYNEICGPLLEEAWKQARLLEGVYVFPFSRGNITPAFEISICAEKSGIENFVLLFEDKGQTYTFSIRTKNSKLDLSRFAERYGGGGHKAAASFRIARDNAVLGKTLAEIIHYYTNGG